MTNKVTITKFLKSNQVQLNEFGAKNIGLFGSFVKGTHKKNSDIDLLVSFVKGKKNYKNFITMAYFLEDGLGRKVDLVTEESLSPYIKPHILKEVEYVVTS